MPSTPINFPSILCGKPPEATEACLLEVSTLPMLAAMGAAVAGAAVAVVVAVAARLGLRMATLW